MLLYCCIAIGATIVSIIHAESASNEAISSQSHERRDVPLSYKHNVIHVYTTTNPYMYSNQPQEQYQHANVQPQTQPQIENYRHIQYAPLPLKKSVEENHKEDGSKTDTPNYNDENYITSSPYHEQAQKNYIDSQLIPTQATNAVRTDYFQYVSGYDINSQRLKNNLVQNKLYGNPNLLIKNKQMNINYLQPQLSQKNPVGVQDLRKNAEVVSQQYANPNAIYTSLSHQFPQNTNKYNDNILKSNESSGVLKPIFYVKAPKKTLNVARTHNIAHAPHKASIDVNSSFLKLPSLPQEFFFNQPLNTQKHPSPKRNVYLIHRTVKP